MAEETPRYAFKVPNDIHGRHFIELLKMYLNNDTYEVKQRYEGPRKQGSYACLKEDATAMRVYIDRKDGNYMYSNEYVSKLSDENWIMGRKINKIKRVIEDKNE